MTLIRADRVFETTATTGTGTYSLAGATTGYRTFASVASNADTVEYCATDGTSWEVGLGTYSLGTIARTSVYASSNSNNAVSWAAGSKNIFLDVPAYQFQNEATFGGGTSEFNVKFNAGDAGFYIKQGSTLYKALSLVSDSDNIGIELSGDDIEEQGRVGPIGSGTDIDLALFAKGSGVVKSYSDLVIGLVTDHSGVIKLLGSGSGEVTIQPASTAGTWTLTLPTNDGNNGEFLQTNGSGVTSWAAGSSGLTVGTTTIASGTTTKVLYDNAGVLGEYTISGSGNVAMTTSPVFTTPNIGSATGSISGNAGTVTVADAGGDTTTWVLLGTSQTGSLAPATDAGLTFNATTNALTATTFIGALTGNADTVTTNANLTGPITSTGNATAIASQTGTGSKFVVDTSPVLVTPNIGVAVGTSLDVSGVLESGANSGTNGQLKLFGSTSGDCTIKTAAAAGTATVFQLPADNGSNTNVLQTNGSGVTSWVAAAAGTIGGSTGAADNILLRSDGTGGATLQASGITVTDATGAMSPTTTDTMALGTTALMWSDLFLASGSVINWNNGDITLTHSTDVLTWAGNTQFNFSGGVTMNMGGTSTIYNTTFATSNTNADTSNFFANASISTGLGSVATTRASLLFGGASTVNNRVSVNGTTSTTLGANNSYASFIIGTAGATEAASGTHALLSSAVIRPVTVTGGVATVTNTATLYIEDAITCTVTGANYALWVDAGATRLDGGLTSGDHTPNANDGSALGTTALQWSDLFLAEGGVINWDNGDATLTQAGNVVTLAGADLVVPKGGPIAPYSAYTADTTGQLAYDLITSAGGNASPSEWGWTVAAAATLSADRTLQLRFALPDPLPGGTLKLRVLSQANATSGDLKFTVAANGVAPTEDPGAVTLTAESQSTVTFATTAYRYTETKVSLTQGTFVAGDIVVMSLVFNDTNTTVAAASNHKLFLIWE